MLLTMMKTSCSLPKGRKGNVFFLNCRKMFDNNNKTRSRHNPSAQTFQVEPTAMAVTQEGGEAPLERAANPAVYTDITLSPGYVCVTLRP